MIERRPSPNPDPGNKASRTGNNQQGGPRKGEARPGGRNKKRKDRSGWIGLAAATAFFTVLLGRMVPAGPAAASSDWNTANQPPASPTVHAGSSLGQPGAGSAPSVPAAPTPGSGGAGTDPGTLPSDPNGPGSPPNTGGPGAPSGSPDSSGNWPLPGDNGQGNNPYGIPQNPPGSFGPPDYGPPAVSPPVDGITGAS